MWGYCIFAFLCSDTIKVILYKCILDPAMEAAAAEHGRSIAQRAAKRERRQNEDGIDMESNPAAITAVVGVVEEDGATVGEEGEV